MICYGHCGHLGEKMLMVLRVLLVVFMIHLGELHPHLVRIAKEQIRHMRGDRIFWRGSSKTSTARRELLKCSRNFVNAGDVQGNEAG